ncbi:transmembrane and coiled-coil domain-containing protein 4-like isoform X2 [Planococcus citri]|uniref:transmembrane and coiled-coil domain-containing protein 4-like isoform X2 n=1 Tax=Planococcus citri TaxID=170843 RepID=UPI0031F8E7C4
MSEERGGVEEPVACGTSKIDKNANSHRNSVHNASFDDDNSKTKSDANPKPNVDVKTKAAVAEQQLALSKLDESNVSEAGRFSLAAICASSLCELFGNEWDADFCSKCIKSVTVSLQLPQRVQPLMNELIKGTASHSVEPYVDLVRAEAFFEKSEDLGNVIFNFITIAVQDGSYDARWRVLLRHISQKLEIDAQKMEEYERMLIQYLLQKYEQSQEEKKATASRKLSAKAKRYAWIGLAAVGGGALIGVTGGIAAPLIGSGLTSVLGSSALFAAIGSTTGIAVVGSLFGVAGGGLTGYKMRKRVGDIEEFEFHKLEPLTEAGNDNTDAEAVTSTDSDTADKSINTLNELHITIAVSGWIKDKNDENYIKAWSHLFVSREQYYLKYESNYLLELGKAMEYIFSFVASFATQEVLKLTVFSGLVTAVTWPAGLLGLASVIDNPWGVCLRRSSQVGKQLAEVLLARDQGHRPVTLVGYSLGARVIFYCLREMSERKNCQGIVQDVILIGAPCTAQLSDWSKFPKVVAGRIINGFNRGDWLLRFLYRTLSMAVDGVAGLQAIDLKDRRMINIDLTDMVTRHSDYPEHMDAILSKIGIPLSCASSSDDILVTNNESLQP